MKYLFIFIPLILIISCSQDKTSDLKGTELSNIKIYDNPDIVGNWTMCATSSNGVMITGNTCQTISFHPNGTGSSYSSSLDAYEFSWSLKNNYLKVLCFVQNTSCVFSDTNYLTTFSKVKDRNKLLIKRMGSDYTCYLSR